MAKTYTNYDEWAAACKTAAQQSESSCQITRGTGRAEARMSNGVTNTVVGIWQEAGGEGKGTVTVPQRDNFKTTGDKDA
jgi:hypothetical protein